ncbi:hypothetical protein ACO0QE_003606 [Hanseniaspora vineae]
MSAVKTSSKPMNQDNDKLEQLTSPGKPTKVQDIFDKGPEFVNDTAIDRFFQDLDTELLSKQNDVSDCDIYKTVGCKSQDDFAIYLVDKIIHLNMILLQQQQQQQQQTAGANPNEATSGNRELIPISLNDMRLLESLTNLFIIHSIYRYLPSGFGIPLDQRNLSKKQNKADNTICINKAADKKVLQQVLRKMVDNIFYPKAHKNQNRTLVFEMFLKGSGFSDMLLGLMYLSLKDANYNQKYEAMESLQSTYGLFEMYTTFYQSGTHTLFKQIVLEKLSTLTTRREEDGLFSLIEFVLGLRETVDNELDISKFNKVNEVVCNKPKSLSNVKYYISIFKQMMRIFSEHLNNDAVITAVNNIIAEFYFKNKRIVMDFLFKQIYIKLLNTKHQNYSVKQTNDLFNILIGFSKQSSTDVLAALIENCNEYDFFFAIWRYCLFVYMNAEKLKLDNDYYKILLSLLKTFMELGDKYYVLNYIILNFNTNKDEEWGKLIIDMETRLARISVEENVKDSLLNTRGKQPSELTSITALQQALVLQDFNITLLIEYLKTVSNEDVTKKLFLSVMNRWCRLKTEEQNQGKEGENSKQGAEYAETTPNEGYDNLLMLSDLKLLEKFNNEFKSELVNEPGEILEFIDNLLKVKDLQSASNEPEVTQTHDTDSDDEEEEEEEEEEQSGSNVLSIILQLLSTMITTVEHLSKFSTVLISIQENLNTLYPNNLQCQTIVQRIDEEVLHRLKNEGNTSNGVKTQEQINEELIAEDRKVLKRAIFSINDPLVPIRAQGLVMLRELLLKKSSVVDCKFVLELHLTQLQDKDPFIYLNVIKGLTSLCEFDPESLRHLITLYHNENHKTLLDEVLKIGEVLINYVQLTNELFQSDLLHLLIKVCLQKINVSGLSSNRVNQQNIIQDNRLRMSSMSILGMILQTNAASLLDSEINDILDCSFGILNFERGQTLNSVRPKRETGEESKNKTKTEPGKEDTSKLMRRSAIHIIHDLLYNSGFERIPAQYNGSRLMNLLHYTRQQESDFLTCELIDQLIKLIDDLVKESLTVREFDDSLISSLKIVQ